MEKRTFDRHNINHVHPNQRRAKAAREMEGVGLRGTRMFGSVDADQDSFDHRPGPPFCDPRYQARAALSRGAGLTSE
jgi:hypothetical protein